MKIIGDHFKEDGDWIWTSFCSEEKYLLGIHADGRGRTVAERFVNGEPDKLKKDHIPIFVTDSYKPYSDILFTRYSFYRIGNRGRGRHGRDELVPDPGLNYGIVEKTRKGKKLQKVTLRQVRTCSGRVSEYFCHRKGQSYEPTLFVKIETKNDNILKIERDDRTIVTDTQSVLQSVQTSWFTIRSEENEQRHIRPGHARYETGPDRQGLDIA